MSAPPERGLHQASPYERIYAIVRRIPRGRLATYGQIAAIEGRSTPRMVGYALSALDAGHDDVPWQRVINSQGTISERRHGGGTARQRRLLEAEGVIFDRRGRVDFDVYAWGGPDLGWTEANGFYPAPVPRRR
ncbi:MAG: MGMT family protein [Gammaproteobacteria bacterium]|nr:MGMT family protein [Gammaproteobacteria bacterium]